MTMELDPRIVDELKATYTSMEDEGKVLSPEELTRYLEPFRNRFGPEKLKNLDGEVLLNTMHNIQNRDSLVYWLEYKDDDEFPSPKFGSIAGGSAFKFGLFRKKETGTWMTGSSKSQESLSTEQAIILARKHRDQLIMGDKLLQDMPIGGSDAVYQVLQRYHNECCVKVCSKQGDRNVRHGQRVYLP